MSTKKPWFPLYAADFLTDTQAMSHEAVGAYLRLLLYQWINGSIPRPPNQMSRIVGCTLDELDTLWIELEAKFEGDHVIVRNSRLEKVRQQQDRFIESRRAAGRASGEARRKKASGNSGQEHVFDLVPDPFPTKGERDPTSQSQSQSKDKNPPTPQRGKRATRLPEDWKPDDKLHAECKLKFPKVDLKTETEKFKDYFIGKGRTYVDWRRTWRNWMRRASESQHTSKTRWTFKMAEDFCIREHLTRHKGESNDAFTDRMRSRFEQAGR
jgi:uncharacterized protein YdaU (DUF1376 family)